MSARFPRASAFATTATTALASIGQIDQLVLIPFLIAAFGAFGSGYASAILYTKFGHEAAVKSHGVSTNKISVTLYTCTSLQIFMLIVLAARATNKLKAIFKSHVIQMVLIWHIFVPNLLITATWAARVMIDSSVVAPSNVDVLLEANSKIKAAFTAHTILLVASNVYSAFVLSFLFPNTVDFFMLAEPEP
jgi:hypothetical protein